MFISRYEELVKAVITLSTIPRYKDLHVKILMFIFIEPDVWLPENKASFLLLAGPEVFNLQIVKDKNM